MITIINEVKLHQKYSKVVKYNVKTKQVEKSK